MKKLILITFLFYLIHLNLLHAKTYYISSTGNDNSSGMATSTAWKSINKVNSQYFTAGDSVLFEGGSTFIGNIYLDSNSKGTSTNPIIISSFGNGKAKIDAKNGHGFFAYNTSGIEVLNLVFVGSGYNVNNGVGVYFFMDLPGNVKLPYIIIDNVDASGFKTAGIQISSWPTDGSRSGYKNIKITNSLAHENALSGISMSGYYNISDTLYSHQNLYIARCIAYNNYGLLGYSTHSGNGIIIGQVEHGIIEYCEAYENGKNNNSPNGGPAAIWTWDSRYVTIQYSYAHHNRTQTGDGDGFDLDGGTQNCILQYNYSHDNDGPGLLIAQYGGARKMKNNIVRYNISERDGNGLGALIWSGDPGTVITAEKIDFYNNTIFVDSAKNPFGNAAIAVYNNYGAVKNIRICNNIFITDHHATHVDINRNINLKFYNNVYYDNGKGYKFKDDGTMYNFIAGWRIGKNQEKINTISVGTVINPKLQNAGGAGNILNIDSLKTITQYILNQNSKIIGKGLYMDSLLGIKDVYQDYYGDSIHITMQYTPGAHEPILPQASFYHKDACLGDSIQFINMCNNAITYKWYWGDGDSSTINSPKHYYKDSGSYTVQLIAMGLYNYTDTTSDIVYIFPNPTTKFVSQNECLGVANSFTNETTDANTFKWNFGDGDTSEAINPTHLFLKNGWYHILLQATSSHGCRGIFNDSLYIYPLPEATFSYTKTGDAFQFTPTDTLPPLRFWDFGDGTTNDTSLKPTHLFAKNGNYTIHLKVTSSYGCKGEDSLLINYIQNGINTVMNTDIQPLKIWPNPFDQTTKLYYILQTETNVKLSIIDPLGRAIPILTNTTQVAGEHELNLADYYIPTSAGIYLVAMQTKSGIYYLKLLKI